MIPPEIAAIDFFKFWKLIVATGKPFELPGLDLTMSYHRHLLIHKEMATTCYALHFEAPTWKVTGVASYKDVLEWRMGHEMLSARIIQRRMTQTEHLPDGAQTTVSQMLTKFEGSIDDCVADMVHVRLAL